MISFAVEICGQQVINEVFVLPVHVQDSHDGFLAICKDDAKDFSLVPFHKLIIRIALDGICESGQA